MRRHLTAVAIAAIAVVSACGPAATQQTQKPSGSSPPKSPVAHSPITTSEAAPTIGSSTATPTAPAAPGNFEFVRWLSRSVELMLEPGSDVVTATTNDEPIAAVLDRRVVDGMEWIKVAVGRGYAQDRVQIAWAPHAADVTQAGKTTHVDPVYEAVKPQCPGNAPTIGDLDAMLPLQALYCFGNGDITLSQAIVRNEGSEDTAFVTGSPDWLAESGALVAYWLPEWTEAGSIRLQIDPHSGVNIDEGEWLEITGHLDDPASGTCSITTDNTEFMLPDADDAIALCRGRFVATAVRALTQAEIPQKPATQTPGPQPETEAEVAIREFKPPIKNRAAAAAVWTGSEMIVWGGFDVTRDAESGPALDDGSAYNPSNGQWRAIASGPLAPRSYAETVWTGSEMLVWGGQKNYRETLSDGAAYDPSTDSWRDLPQAPFKWHPTGASVWTGTEWWIATEHGGQVEVAAYDPAAQEWRTVAGVSEDDFDGLSLAWTGSEVLMKTVRGLYRMEPHASDWTFVDVDFSGPITWANGLVYGSRFDNAASEPLHWDPFFHPVAWDPTTSTEHPMAAAPDSAYDSQSAVWTGQYLVFFEDDLAYDTAHDKWIGLNSPHDPEVLGWDYVLENEGTAKVWTGDRLLIWGGTNPCAWQIGNVDTGYELIPSWPNPTAAREASLIGRQSAPSFIAAARQSVPTAC